MGNNKNIKSIEGIVVSTKMDKVITIQYVVQRRHPMYEKFVKRHVKVKARDEKSEAKMGDTVKIVETRPLTKTTHWKLVEIIEKAPEEK